MRYLALGTSISKKGAANQLFVVSIFLCYGILLANGLFQGLLGEGILMPEGC